MQLDLNFDLTNKSFVRGIDDTGFFKVPDQSEEDKVPIVFRAFRQISWIKRPFYKVVSLSGYSLEIAVGTPGVKNASQTSWTLNAAENELSGVLNLKTTEISALSDGASQRIEAVLTSATETYRTSQEIKINKSVSTDAAVTPVPGATNVTLEQGKAIWLPRRDVRSFIMKSLPNGTKRSLFYLDDTTGTLQSRPLS